MAITTTREKMSGGGRSVNVPYWVQEQDEALTLTASDAIDEAAAAAAADFGFAPADFTFSELSKHTYRVTVSYDTPELQSHQADPAYVPVVTRTDSLRIVPPPPAYLSEGLSMLQKTSGAPGALGKPMEFIEQRLLGEPSTLLIPIPQENYQINFKMPANLLTASMVTAYRRAAHRLNAAAWGVYPAQTVMLVRADVVRNPSGVAIINAGFAAGDLYDYSWTNAINTLEFNLTDVKPFSRISFWGKKLPFGTGDEARDVIEKSSLYEVQVHPTADYSLIA